MLGGSETCFRISQDWQMTPREQKGTKSLNSRHCKGVYFRMEVSSLELPIIKVPELPVENIKSRIFGIY